MSESDQSEHYVYPGLDLEELKAERDENEFRRSDTDDFDDENDQVRTLLNPKFSDKPEGAS